MKLKQRDLLVLFCWTLVIQSNLSFAKPSNSEIEHGETSSRSEEDVEVRCGSGTSSVRYSEGSPSFAAVRPPVFTVSLDEPASTRWPWKDIVAHYNSSMFAALAMIDYEIPTKFLETFAEDEAAKLLGKLGDYGEEMSALANEINISTGKVILLNVIYDVVAGFCTSIVASNSDGILLHARNLDFDLATVLANLTMEVEFQRNNATIAVGTTFAGYVGLLTGMHVDQSHGGIGEGYSVSLNERDSGLPIYNLLEYWFVPDTWDPALLIRYTLENYNNFSSAVDVLSNTSLVAPCYIMVVGTSGNDGVVITRDRSKSADLWYLNAQSKEWFLVQTNHDHWKTQKIRAVVAKLLVSAMGRENVSLEALYRVLSTVPVINHSTTYTTLMSAQLGNYSSYARTTVPRFSSKSCSILSSSYYTSQ